MARITHILCPVDFSSASGHAIDLAVTLARWYRARITALHVYASPAMSVPGLPIPVDRLSNEERVRAWNQTEDCFRSATDSGLQVDVMVEGGQPARQILDSAARLPADVIVMGTHGATGFEHLVLGSVAEKVLRKAPCPVLTSPPRAASHPTSPFTRIVCGVDFSDWSLKALTYATAIARESGAAVTLVHVIEWPWEEPPAPSFSEMPAAQAGALSEYRRYLETTARVRLQALVPEGAGDRWTVRVCHGRPYVELLHVADEEHADLVALGVHGRGGFDVMLFGSTTNQVVRRAACPVLTLRC